MNRYESLWLYHRLLSQFLLSPSWNDVQELGAVMISVRLFHVDIGYGWSMVAVLTLLETNMDPPNCKDVDNHYDESFWEISDESS